MEPQEIEDMIDHLRDRVRDLEHDFSNVFATRLRDWEAIATIQTTLLTQANELQQCWKLFRQKDEDYLTLLERVQQLERSI